MIMGLLTIDYPADLATWSEADVRTWLATGAGSDALMALVRRVAADAATSAKTRLTPAEVRVARLAACRHDGSRCVGELARRGYPGHHAPGCTTRWCQNDLRRHDQGATGTVVPDHGTPEHSHGQLAGSRLWIMVPLVWGSRVRR